MIKLGIIGAENSHSYCIGKVCNIDKKVPMRTTHIWGETREAASNAADKAKIPNIVDDWREMLGLVDGVMINQRHGAHHFESAEFFIKNGVPTFVDKPMTTDLNEAKVVFKLAGQKKTPVCTFSLIPLQQAFRKFARNLATKGTIQALNTSGPVDLDSPYGGIFFYGFHQIDAMVEIMGTEAKSVSFQRNGQNGVATILFSGNRMATMNCIANDGIFHWRVCTDKGVFVLPHQYDKDIYLASTKAIHRLIAKGEVPWNESRMLAPIAILEALQKSLDSGSVQLVHELA